MAKHPNADFRESPEYKLGLKELKEITDSNGLSMGKITLSEIHAEVFESLCDDTGVESRAVRQGRVLLVECAQLREVFEIDEEGLVSENNLALDLRVERPTTKAEQTASLEKARRDGVSNSTRIANSSPMETDTDPTDDEDSDGPELPDDGASESTSGESGKSPVADQNAADAKDSISRMTSKDKLEAIVTYESRATVASAAQKRLDELG